MPPIGGLFNVVAKDDSKEAIVRMFGYVGTYYPVNSNDFSKALDQLNEKYDRIKLYINSPGGDVAEGTAIFNLIQNNPVPIDTYNIGMAASMGGILLQAGQNRYMAKNAKLMIHKVSGGTYGNSEKLRETADIMDKWEEDLLAVFVDRTGLAEDTVKAWFQRDKDTWFNSKDALKNKLVDGLIEPVITKKTPSNLLKMEAHQVWSFYNSALLESVDEPEEEASNGHQIDNQNTDMELKNALLAAFKLPTVNAQSPDAEIVASIKKLIEDKDAAISSLTNEKEGLEKKINDQAEAVAKEKAEALVDNAISANKLQKGEREAWVNDAIANYDLAKRAIDKLPVYKPLTSQIEKDGDGEDKRPKGSASARLKNIQEAQK